jgi:hypothetical protein
LNLHLLGGRERRKGEENIFISNDFKEVFGSPKS